MQINKKRLVARIAAIALVVSAVGFQTSTVFALSLTSLSDNMSRLQASTAANHEIKFVTPSGGGVAAGETITLTFSADFTGVSGILFSDVDFATGNSNNCTSATFTEQTLAATPSGATWGLASSGSVITLTSGTGTVTADRCVRFKIGTNATNQTTGVNQISNGAADDDDTVSIAGTFGDTGTISVDIIADDQVDVTATVSPSITFSISQTAIDFGTLSAADDIFATAGAGSGGNTSAATIAHTLIAGTNATSGYVIYLLGATLTSGANTITAPAGPGTSTVGSEQFGLHIADGGGGSGITVDSQYGTSSQYGWGATGSTQDNIASASGATASNTFNATYVGNIGSSTEAGAYTTTLTYTATATY